MASAGSAVLEGDAAAFATAIRSLINNPQFSDVTFVVGRERQEVFAHRCILACRCRAFPGVLSQPQPDAQEPQPPPAPLVLSHVQPEVFLAVVEFLYTNRVTLHSLTALEVLTSAVEYGLDDLRKLQGPVGGWTAPGRERVSQGRSDGGPHPVIRPETSAGRPAASSPHAQRGAAALAGRWRGGGGGAGGGGAGSCGKAPAGRPGLAGRRVKAQAPFPARAGPAPDATARRPAPAFPTQRLALKLPIQPDQPGSFPGPSSAPWHLGAWRGQGGSGWAVPAKIRGKPCEHQKQGARLPQASGSLPLLSPSCLWG
ncbi:BTB/POZ domain-containing protein 19 isoform X1 [Pelodiscus sinensis]|uniref:BTB/POZ domain-containing protein 19 isoform X1 n=1 Tax=Pelodiscus sinensis TaxID=13735 RepID=UPI003F6D1C9C